MPRNGSGTFSLVAGNPVVTGASISSTTQNNTMADVASALTQSLSKDGQTTPVANLTMGGFKLTNLAAGSLVGDSLRYEQLFSQGVPIDIASGATVDIGGQNTTFLNVTGNTTITSLGTNYNGPRLLKFVASLTLTYNATTLITPSLANFIVSAGSYAIAVPKSTTSGTADGWKIISYQQADGSTQPFVDINPVVIGSVDATKKTRFEVDGLTTATTRVLTVQDKDIAIAGLDDVNNAIATAVHLIGNETIAGIKTFTSQPVFPTQSMIRLNGGGGYGTTNTAIRRLANITINQGSDITYADSTSLGASFTINSNGVYAISYNENFNAATNMGISLNSNQLTTSISSINAADRLAITDIPNANFNSFVGWAGYLNAGSVIRPHAAGASIGSGSATAQFTAVRIA